MLRKIDVLGAALARTDPVTAAVILAYGDDPAAAAADLQAQPSSEARDVALATAAWLGGDPDAAIASLTAQLALDRGSWYTAGWLARVARLSGDASAADRYARWATIVEADAADWAISEYSVVPATPADAGAGIPANYPWSVYLRPVPPFLYPPQLTTIAAR
jgi:hypothetical protein